MPIFQDDLDHQSPDNPPPIGADAGVGRGETARLRRPSEESLGTEFCEGPVPDETSEEELDDRPPIPNRAELIERLKRAQSPTWIPNRHLDSILQHHDPVSPGRRPKTPTTPSGLLPAAQITPEKNDDAAAAAAEESADSRFRDGLEIERPRSALHSGDFTTDEPAEDPCSSHPARDRINPSQTPTKTPWMATSPRPDFAPFDFDQRILFPDCVDSFRSGASPPSSSLSSSFVYKPPTSPLVQSESYDDPDLSQPLGGIDISSGRFARRYTTHSALSSPYVSPSPRMSLPPGVGSYRARDVSFPYQAHQPRRSLTSVSSLMHPSTSPQTPAFLRSRRSSIVSDNSPLHHASMVGSYEESILRGRMSTTPSKPLDFLAQIGVLGKGKCKASLRCPPHVTLAFPAVYYSYGSTSYGRSQADDGPSPYVGQIDLENGLPNPEEEQRAKRKAQTRLADRRLAEEHKDTDKRSPSPDRGRRRAPRAGRKTGSTKAPPGGSYRVPEKGQIQIIIKNPNKTAVKLFLVPYDLTGMEPGTKTFVRQRAYSAGPIIENVPPTSDLDSADRPILRYLVHMHICCPAKGRFYLYKSIRIVFANRVPDGKERLRNETTWPEPRYTPYKPVRAMNPPGPATSGPGANLAAEKAFRRRSAGVPTMPSSHAFDAMDGVYHHHLSPISQYDQNPGTAASGNTLPIEPIPFCLPARERLDSDVSNATSATTAAATTIGLDDLRSPASSQVSRPTTKDSTAVASPFSSTLYEKLNKGDLGYGGNAFAPSSVGAPNGAESLLSQRLRSLGVKTPSNLTGDGHAPTSPGV